MILTDDSIPEHLLKKDTAKLKFKIKFFVFVTKKGSLKGTIKPTILLENDHKVPLARTLTLFTCNIFTFYNQIINRF